MGGGRGEAGQRLRRLVKDWGGGMRGGWSETEEAGQILGGGRGEAGQRLRRLIKYCGKGWSETEEAGQILWGRRGGWSETE